MQPVHFVSHFLHRRAVSSAQVRVRDSLCDVDAEIACAWCPEDEMQVKSMIEETIGFEKVNAKVQELMIAWVATMVKDSAVLHGAAECVQRSPWLLSTCLQGLSGWPGREWVSPIEAIGSTDTASFNYAARQKERVDKTVARSQASDSCCFVTGLSATGQATGRPPAQWPLRLSICSHSFSWLPWALFGAGLFAVSAPGEEAVKF